MPESPERIALYRYFDSEGTLLYVGISNDPTFRSKAHLYERRPDSWPQRAARRTDEWHNSRKLALDAEKVAIQTERPLYNGTHNYDDVEFDPTSWPTVGYGRKAEQIADLIRGEIAASRWRPGQRLPPIRRMTESHRGESARDQQGIHPPAARGPTRLRAGTWPVRRCAWIGFGNF